MTTHADGRFTMIAEQSNRSLALLRWSLVVIFLWFGAMKFTAYEAAGIAPFIEHSPIMAWLDFMFGAFPGWFQMFTEAAKERGWPPPTQTQFEHMCGPHGAFVVGDPKSVAAKILHVNSTLGGVSRFTFQMSTAALETGAMRRSIELLGSEVAPLVREASRPAF
jgi:hypothetical protein